MTEFLIGNRVKVVGLDARRFGQIGVIKAFHNKSPSQYPIEVEFDDKISVCYDECELELVAASVTTLRSDFNTLADIPAEQILAEAAENKFKRLTIIAVLEDGEEYYASTTSDLGAVFWDLDVFKFERIKSAR